MLNKIAKCLLWNPCRNADVEPQKSFFRFESLKSLNTNRIIKKFVRISVHFAYAISKIIFCLSYNASFPCWVPGFFRVSAICIYGVWSLQMTTSRIRQQGSYRLQGKNCACPNRDSFVFLSQQ